MKNLKYIVVLSFILSALLYRLFTSPLEEKREMASIGEKVLNCISATKSFVTNKDGLKLVSSEDEVLQTVARPISVEDIPSDEVQTLIDKMISRMKRSSGVGIAAPQVGESLRVCIVGYAKPKVMINPKIKVIDSKKIYTSEGCLSLPGACGRVARDKEIEVTYFDRTGKEITERFKGSKSIVVQHEIDHLDGILFPQKVKGYSKTKFDIELPEYLDESVKQKFTGFLLSLSNEEVKTLKSLTKKFNKDIKEIDDPFSLIGSLKEVDSLKDNEKLFNELVEFYQIHIKSKDDVDFYIQKINDWITSDAHALFAYDHLFRDGIYANDNNKALYRNLIESNKFFKDLKTSGVEIEEGEFSPLITYSFEKEGSKYDIADLYKVPKYTDEEWLDLSYEERIKLLDKSTSEKKKFLPATKVTKTGLAPEYLSGYSRELEGVFSKRGYSWEISNKKYEISLRRLKEQVKDIAGIFKETHSFHMHIVFDLPKNYKKFKNFVFWTKHVNDYLYLKGMEEALHGDKLTNVASLRKWYDLSFLNPFSIGKNLPTNLSMVNYQGYKFFSMGVRGWLYGDGVTDATKKVGLELRDVSRSAEVQAKHLDDISESVKKASWESISPKEVKKINPTFLWMGKIKALNELRKIVGTGRAAQVILASRTAHFPLIPFEKGKYLDYRTGTYITPTKEQAQRIVEAREAYIKELKSDVAEFKEHKFLSQSIVEHANQWALTGWAKKARVSELFEGI